MSALKKGTLLGCQILVYLYQRKSHSSLYGYTSSVKAHLFQISCRHIPLLLWIFAKQYILPWILFLQAVKWSFPSFKQLLKSHPSSSLLRLIGQLKGFLFFSACTWSTHCYSLLPDHALSSHCLTPITRYLSFLYIGRICSGQRLNRKCLQHKWIAHKSKSQNSTIMLWYNT